MCLKNINGCSNSLVSRKKGGFHGPIETQKDLEEYAANHPNSVNVHGENAHQEFIRVSNDETIRTRLPKAHLGKSKKVGYGR